jgi:glycosyltransferase involved in cell wall biosynthesis
MTGKGENILVCPQGVDPGSFRPSTEAERMKSRRGMGIGDTCFVILTVGFLINRKGFTGIFRVLQQLDADFRYIVAGEFDFGRDHFMRGHAAQAEVLKNEGSRLLGTRLMLTGPVERIQDYYRAADLVLINSSSEGMPNTLLEAMACGKVVLVKDIPGIRFIVEHMETGIVFQQESEMRDYLVRLINEPALCRRIGDAAAEYVRSRASFEQVWQRLEAGLIQR